VSTLLLYPDHQAVHPRLKELVPKLKAWSKKYKGKFIARVSDRLVMQMAMDTTTISAMRSQQMESIVCGYTSCGKTGKDLTACSACRLQRYCSPEHQKKDWKYHKHICNKGLVEPAS